MPIPLVARGLWRGSAAARFFGIVGSNPAGDTDVCLLWVVCCQVEVSASSSSLLQRSPTECGVSEYDRESSIMMRTWSTGGCCAMKRKVDINFGIPRKKLLTHAPPPPPHIHTQATKSFHVTFRSCMRSSLHKMPVYHTRGKNSDFTCEKIYSVSEMNSWEHNYSFGILWFPVLMTAEIQHSGTNSLNDCWVVQQVRFVTDERNDNQNL
jgi:hypothetical protein